MGSFYFIKNICSRAGVERPWLVAGIPRAMGSGVFRSGDCPDPVVALHYLWNQDPRVLSPGLPAYGHVRKAKDFMAGYPGFVPRHPAIRLVTIGPLCGLGHRTAGHCGRHGLCLDRISQFKSTGSTASGDTACEGDQTISLDLNKTPRSRSFVFSNPMMQSAHKGYQDARIE